MAEQKVTPKTFKAARWEDVNPLYEEMANRPLGVQNVEAWLAEWSNFEEATGRTLVAGEMEDEIGEHGGDLSAESRNRGEDKSAEEENDQAILQPTVVS